MASVFERRAPQSIDRVEGLIGTRIGGRNTTRDFRDEVLDALTDAYREAVGRDPSTQNASSPAASAEERSRAEGVTP